MRRRCVDFCCVRTVPSSLCKNTVKLFLRKRFSRWISRERFFAVDTLPVNWLDKSLPVSAYDAQVAFAWSFARAEKPLWMRRAKVLGRSAFLKISRLHKVRITVTWSTQSLYSRGGHGSGVPESTLAGFFVILSDPESQIFEKPDPESLLKLGSSRSPRGHFLCKTIGNFWLYGLQPESEQELDSNFRIRIQNFWTRSGVESESEKVTPATSAIQQCVSELADGGCTYSSKNFTRLRYFCVRSAEGPTKRSFGHE